MSRESGKITSESQAEPLLSGMEKSHGDIREVGADGIPPLSEAVSVICIAGYDEDIAVSMMQNNPYAVTGGITSVSGLVLLRDEVCFMYRGVWSIRKY